MSTLKPLLLDETGQAIVEELSLIRENMDGALRGRVATIEGKIPAQASSSNQLADKDFVNSSIQNVAAFYITKDAAGNPFATKAELTAATVFYSGGQVRVPTRNDYCVVLADESKTIAETGENPTTRYLYDNGVWSYQYIVNRSGLTAAQWAAVNSGITAPRVAKIDGAEQTSNKVQSLDRDTPSATEYPSEAAVVAGTASQEEVTDIRRERFGNVSALGMDMKSIPTVFGFPMILYADTAPDVDVPPYNWDEATMGRWGGAPCFVGQIYLNVTGKKAYIATACDSVSGWTILN